MNRSGMTLTELVMALAIFSLLCSVAVPGFYRQVERYRFQSASLELYAVFLFAKSEAVRRGRHVGLLINDTRIIVFLDRNGSRQFDKDDDIIRIVPLSSTLKIVSGDGGSNRYIYVFDRKGMTATWGRVVWEGAGGSREIVVSRPANIHMGTRVGKT
ncbi:GspH/FimT family pseudopilin [Desulfobotulus sp. H1]|uniref:Type II secretion system protein H n=1 Tax=Desulfobotulus pelophilus TaxID=2823377 RepID=A0ABT3NEC6_9BACT|nr:GspH/FimT family pseudopilin [Desulfobotulus pelophilus]MCW7755252.1 GspH/FimT family pseudopilin [Desulfobotulus pelophilus]